MKPLMVPLMPPRKILTSSLQILAKSQHPLVHRNATWGLACMTACDNNHVPMRASIDTLLLVCCSMHVEP